VCYFTYKKEGIILLPLHAYMKNSTCDYSSTLYVYLEETTHTHTYAQLSADQDRELTSTRKMDKDSLK